VFRTVITTNSDQATSIYSIIELVFTADTQWALYNLELNVSLQFWIFVIKHTNYKIQNSSQLLKLFPLTHSLLCSPNHRLTFTSRPFTLPQAFLYQKDKRPQFANFQGSKLCFSLGQVHCISLHTLPLLHLLSPSKVTQRVKTRTVQMYQFSARCRPAVLLLCRALRYFTQAQPSAGSCFRHLTGRKENCFVFYNKSHYC
jgi:hypothetical protein